MSPPCVDRRSRRRNRAHRDCRKNPPCEDPLAKSLMARHAVARRAVFQMQLYKVIKPQRRGSQRAVCRTSINLIQLGSEELHGPHASTFRKLARHPRFQTRTPRAVAKFLVGPPLVITVRSPRMRIRGSRLPKLAFAAQRGWFPPSRQV